MKIDIFEKAGAGLKIVTSIGTGAALGNIATVFMESSPLGLPVKACAYVSSYILSMLLTEKTDEYIDRKTDEYKREFEDMKAMVEAIGQEATTEEG